MSSSDTTAQVELDAVIKQIQGTMTSEQVKAIDAMTLTRQSTNEVLQSLGMAPNAPSAAQGTPAAGQSSSGSSSSTRGNDFPAGGPGTDGGGPGGGGFQAGGAPGGDMGGVPPDAAAGTNGAQATPNATAQARMSAQATRVSPMLLQALIQVLQSKVQ